jgi:hypothetical protein
LDDVLAREEDVTAVSFKMRKRDVGVDGRVDERPAVRPDPGCQGDFHDV